MLGLDNAGKTTLLYKLRPTESVNLVHIPTIGFNVEQFKRRGIEITLWELGGDIRIRHLWNHHLREWGVIIFVVDSTDRQRLPHAKSMLDGILKSGMVPNSVLMVLANKQNLPDAMSTNEVSEHLGLHNMRDRKWNCMGVDTITSAWKAIDWIIDTSNGDEVT